MYTSLDRPLSDQTNALDVLFECYVPDKASRRLYPSSKRRKQSVACALDDYHKVLSLYSDPPLPKALDKLRKAVLQKGEGLMAR